MATVLEFGVINYNGLKLTELISMKLISMEKRGGPEGGQTLGPMLKSLHSGAKGGGGGPESRPLPPPDPPMQLL